MPYIKNEDRATCDLVVQEMHNQKIEPNGKLNYILFKFCLETVGIKPSYNALKNYCGELEECIAEIRRRITANYEDIKIEENGDVEQTKDNTHMKPFKMENLE